MRRQEDVKSREIEFSGSIPQMAQGWVFAVTNEQNRSRFGEDEYGNPERHRNMDKYDMDKDRGSTTGRSATHGYPQQDKEAQPIEQGVDASEAASSNMDQLGVGAGEPGPPASETSPGMDRSTLGLQGIPRWFMESLDTSQKAEGILRNVRLELRHLVQTAELEAETLSQLEGALSALERVAGSLMVLQITAQKVLDEVLEKGSE